jgi:Fic family protein
MYRKAKEQMESIQLFTPSELDPHELEAIKRIEELKTNLRYAVAPTRRWTGMLRRNAFARAIRGSNSIEGIKVSKDDAVAAVEGEEPIDQNSESADWLAVMGYRQAMTYVLQLANDPHFHFSTALIRSLHYMMIEYDLNQLPGKWRLGNVYVHDDAVGQVYEGPPPEEVPALMEVFMTRLEREDKSTPCIIRAAMAHLNMAMIHPFKDGNGRMARCLQTLVLAREGTVGAEFLSIEEYLGVEIHTREYYAILAEVGSGKWNPGRDTRPWIRFCLNAHYRQAMRLLRRIRIASRMWEKLESEVKRLELPERTLAALMDAAWGYRVRNVRYRKAAAISDQLASRDLNKLVAAGFLVPTGRARGRMYEASETIKKIREESREPRVEESLFS